VGTLRSGLLKRILTQSQACVLIMSWRGRKDVTVRIVNSTLILQNYVW
jgi:hypothetical protein